MKESEISAEDLDLIMGKNILKTVEETRQEMLQWAEHRRKQEDVERRVKKVLERKEKMRRVMETWKMLEERKHLVELWEESQRNRDAVDQLNADIRKRESIESVRRRSEALRHEQERFVEATKNQQNGRAKPDTNLREAMTILQHALNRKQMLEAKVAKVEEIGREVNKRTQLLEEWQKTLRGETENDPYEISREDIHALTKELDDLRRQQVNELKSLQTEGLMEDEGQFAEKIRRLQEKVEPEARRARHKRDNFDQDELDREQEEARNARRMRQQALRQQQKEERRKQQQLQQEFLRQQEDALKQRQLQGEPIRR